MSEENYTAFDVSDLIEDTNNFLESEMPSSDDLETDPGETTINQDSEFIISETPASTEKKTSVTKSDIRITKLPINRIKTIMKMDPDVNVINGDSAFLITKATELFLETLAKETYAAMPAKKRKTITKKYLDHVIGVVDPLCFLEGALNF